MGNFRMATKNQILAMMTNGQNLDEIFQMYNEKEFYKISYGDLEQENFRWKYPVKFILAKFDIPSVNSLIYLISQRGEVIGTCEFCKNEIRKFHTRATLNRLTCYCVANCSKCQKPGAKHEIQNGKCSSCSYVPPVEDTNNYYPHNYTLEEKYNGCMTQWDAKDILDIVETEELDKFITFAQNKIKFLKKIRKIMT